VFADQHVLALGVFPTRVGMVRQVSCQ